ncbi:GGDEF domain-containing protein [Alsobacter soli]|uniref:diguanylate cyclase n=1 Tax=Alsobacter soli TaxID=2109933 RepID=A0A2T1HZ70_9HYPH|nr:GGDEF domain-containing protein [Alsobacter soli]PSC06996.1 GGDEF domain-containing protein [Alsobacter soli]
MRKLSRTVRLKQAPSPAQDVAPSPEARRIAELTRELAAAQARVRELEELAHVDELTGALNRRGFLRELRRALSYTERYGVPVSLALLDLDGFKAVNDLWGHPAGDAVLAHTAQALSSRLRASDIVGRLGGDEFAILLWHAPGEVAADKAAALSRTLSADPIRWAGHEISIRASFGVQQLEAGQSVEDALQGADRRLYAAKAAAR